MKTPDALRSLLRSIDGRSYKAYERIKGDYAFGSCRLTVDYVQPDPFAPPSQLIVSVPQAAAGFPVDLFSNSVRAMALEDFLTRMFHDCSSAARAGSRGTGGSGLISIDRPPQEVIKRAAVLVGERTVEARFVVGLPARGRTVLGRQAEELLLGEVPRIVGEAFTYRRLDAAAVRRHVDTVEDSDSIRRGLAERGLIAFIAAGAILPRASGVDDRPLTEGTVVPFEPPDSLMVEFHAPHRGAVRGMGIPAGVTLVVGEATTASRRCSTRSRRECTTTFPETGGSSRSPTGSP